MNKVLVITLIVGFLSACGIANFENVSSITEYNSLIKQRFILTKELKIHAISLDQKIKALYRYSLTKPPGIAGREILWQKALPIGTVIEITKIERCTDCLFLSLYRAELILPFFNNYLGRNLMVNYSSLNSVIVFFVAILLGVLGGLYPAFIISAFKPSEVLKSNQSTENSKSIKFRFYLVLMQFTISILLFVSTAVIFNQFLLIKNYDYGYNNENLLMTWGGDHEMINEKLELISKRLTASAQFSSITGARNITFGGGHVVTDAIRTAEMSRDNPIMMNYMGVTYDFFKTFEIPIINGRTFSRARNDTRATNKQLAEGSDHIGSLILNQSALKALNFKTPEEALGKTVYMAVGNNDTEYASLDLEAPFNIIGIVPDVHHFNLKTPTKPSIYQLQTNSSFYITMRHSGDNVAALKTLASIWREELPDSKLNPVFSEDLLEVNYGAELKQMTMFAIFSALAIFIACLGLFGLASFTAERRTKEIGIRKVFGAESWQIVKLLVWQFSKPVLIANIIAWPIAYLAMSRWLESFVYRIDDTMIIALCLIAGLTALLIAWATVAGNSYAVARQNPIKALRYE